MPLSVRLHPSYSKRLKFLTDTIQFEVKMKEAKRQVDAMYRDGTIYGYCSRLQERIVEVFGAYLMRSPSKPNGIPYRPSDPRE